MYEGHWSFYIFSPFARLCTNRKLSKRFQKLNLFHQPFGSCRFPLFRNHMKIMLHDLKLKGDHRACFCYSWVIEMCSLFLSICTSPSPSLDRNESRRDINTIALPVSRKFQVSAGSLSHIINITTGN